jgi:hypothetical protein
MHSEHWGDYSPAGLWLITESSEWKPCSFFVADGCGWFVAGKGPTQAIGQVTLIFAQQVERAFKFVAMKEQIPA